MIVSRTIVHAILRIRACWVPNALFAVLGLVLSLVATSAQAQRWENRTAGEIARAEAQCKLAAGRMFTGINAQEQRGAIGIARHCPDTGAALIARRWREPPADSSVVKELAFHSTLIIDARIVEAASEAIVNRAHASSVRLGALRVLVSQFDPSMDMEFGRILQDTATVIGTGQRLIGPEYVSTIIGSPALPQTRGRSEITPALRSRVLESLRSFEQAGNDDRYLLLAVKGVIEYLSRPPRR